MDGYNKSDAPSTATDAGNSTTKINYVEQGLAGNNSEANCKENPKK